MTCVTGLKLYSYYFPMTYIRDVACHTFLDLRNEPPGSQFIAWRDHACTIATRYAKKSFTEFQEAFCKEATPGVQATAQLINDSMKGFYFKTGIASALVAGALALGAKMAHQNGYPTLAKVLAAGSALTGIYSFGSFRSLYTL